MVYREIKPVPPPPPRERLDDSTTMVLQRGDGAAGWGEACVGQRARSVSVEVGNHTSLVSRVPEYIVMLVTSYFRYLASAPKVRWRARAGALSLG
jgi:L-alanine-DL-glutamate epimerase-like enolase superfamily enzyme